MLQKDQFNKGSNRPTKYNTKLSITKLKKYPGLESLSDEQAKEAEEGITTLAAVLLEQINPEERTAPKKKSTS